jgi:hypothetical protein
MGMFQKKSSDPIPPLPSPHLFSRHLIRALVKLVWISEGGYAHGSAEKQAVIDRLGILAAEGDAPGSSSNSESDAKFEASMGYAMVTVYLLLEAGGLMSYRPVSPPLLADLLEKYKEGRVAWERTAWASPSPIVKSYAHNVPICTMSMCSRMHRNPQFDAELYTGAEGCLLRRNIEAYDFESMHKEQKDSWGAHDSFMFVGNEVVWGSGLTAYSSAFSARG